MSNKTASNKLTAKPEFPDFNRQARGTYDGDTFVFHRGHKTYKGTEGKLEFISRRGGNHVIVKAFSDSDDNGRFSRDELIFSGAVRGDGLDRLTRTRSTLADE